MSMKSGQLNQMNSQRSSKGIMKTQQSQGNKGGGVEEEFIGNLQQQIYFLELEIKMLKEKERQHGGLMNDSESGPLTENIFHIRNKYQQIQRALEAQIDGLAAENKELSVRNGTLLVNMERAVKERSDFEVFLRKATAHYDSETDRMRKAVSEADYNTKEIVAKTKAEKAESEGNKTRAGEYKLQINKLNLEVHTQEEQLARMEEEKEKMIEEKNKEIIDYTNKVNELAREKARNTAEITLEALNKELQQKQNELTLEKDSFRNRIKMLEHSRNVTQAKCRQLIVEKKQFQDEIAVLEQTLENERSQSNAQNIIQERVKDKEQQQILVCKNSADDCESESKQQLQLSYTKRDKNTNLTEKINELNFNIEEKTFRNGKMKKVNTKAMNKLIKMDAEHRENQVKQREIEARNEDMEKKIDKSRDEGKLLLIENQRLKDKVNYLMRKIEINEQLKNIDLDELKTLSRTNMQMNSMMNQLVDKWDFVKQLNESETESRRDY